MLEGYRHLSLEVGETCNLSKDHPWCPSGEMRFADMSHGTMTKDDMLRVIREAVALGFTGYVGFHFYNEPLLRRDLIREVIEESEYGRFMLWTNGVLLTQDDADLFEWVVVTEYQGIDYSHLDRISHKRLSRYASSPDRRKSIYDSPAMLRVNCWRHRIEVAVDHYGNVHLCCQDWKNSLGNIHDDPLEEILLSTQLDYVSLMSDGTNVPDVCRCCTSQQTFDDYQRGRQ